MLESVVESHLKRSLEKHGFKVLKLTCPGTSGVMDRIILRPKYQPGPPIFVECKRPGKDLRPLQAAVGNDWRARGADVRTRVTTIEEVNTFVLRLLAEQAI